MASTIILSDNGASSGSAGLKSSGGNDGVLILQTTTSGGTATNALYINTSQNVGLGVTPSTYNIGKAVEVGAAGNAFWTTSNDVYLTANTYYQSGYKYAASNFASMYEQTSGSHKWFTAASGTAGNAISFTQAMTLDASGNLGIGLTSPASKLHVAGDVIVGLNSSASNILYIGSGGQVSSNGGSSPLKFGIDGTEKARIDSSGNLLVGTTSSAKGSSGSIFSAGSAQENIRLNGTAPQTFVTFNLSGSTVGSISATGSTTTYATSSDYRLKENVAPMTDALETVAKLKPCTYTWKIDGADGQGFIAHELAEVCPDAVVGEKDAVDAEGNPQYQGIDTSFLVATLTAAIQEQQALITTLTERITALEAK